MSLAHQVCNNILENAAGGATGEPSVPFIFALTVPNGATTSLIWVLPAPFGTVLRVVDCWLIKTNAPGGVGDTATLNISIGIVTDAMDLNVADTTIVRAGLIDDSKHESFGVLRVQRVSGAGDNSCLVYAMLVRT